MMHGQMGWWHIFTMLLFALVLVVPVWRICTRLGYPGILGLLVLVPFANLGLLYFLAFARWPIDR